MLKNNTKTIYHTLAAGITSLYILTVLLRFRFFPAQAAISGFMVLVGVGAIVLVSLNFKLKHIYTYLFTFLLLISFLLSALFTGNYDRVIHGITFIAINAGVALLLVSGHANSKAIGILFYGTILYFLYFIVLGVSARDVPSHNSYNSISIVVIVASVAYYAISHLKHGRVTIFPALLTFIVCVWAIGRSGILASFVLLAGIYFVKYKNRRNIIFVAFSLTFIIVFLLGYDFLSNAYVPTIFTDSFLTAIDRFDSDEPRALIWGNYLNNLDSYRLFFGSNTFEDSWPDGQDLAFNYHNAFIHLHSRTGLVGLLLVALTILALIRFWKFNRIYFVLFLTLIIRISTDWVMFFESFDFLFFYFIFFCISAFRNEFFFIYLHGETQRNCIFRSPA